MPKSVRQSLLISFSQTYILLVSQFLASLVIARLLTPAELGIFSITAIFIGIGQALRDFGVVEYIVQEKDLNEERIRSASTLAFVAAWSIGIIALLISGVVADFYEVPDLAALIQILAVNFFIIPFGSIVKSYLRRQLEFGKLARMQLAVSISQSILTVVLAYLGFSYFSMAYSAVAATILSIVLVQFVRPKGFPFIPSWRGINRVFSFGCFSSLRSLLLDMEKGSPDLVLGRLMNMEAVGYFGRAAGLVDLFNRLVVQATRYVALPHLSAKVRAGEEVAGAFLHAISFLTVLAWPFYAFLALFADELIPFLYGSQWHASVPLVQLICLGELLLAPFYLQAQLAISMGHVRLETLRVLAMLVLRLTPLFLLYPYGLNVVVAGYAGSSVFIAALSIFVLRHFLGIQVWALLLSCRASFGVFLACLSIMGVSLVVVDIAALSGGERLSAACASGIAGWLIGVWLFRHPVRCELRRGLRSLKAAVANVEK